MRRNVDDVGIALPTGDDDDVTPVAEQNRHDPAYQADDHGSEHRRPESLHVEALDQYGRQPQAKGVEQEDEETERHQRERQGQEQEHRPDDGVDEPQDRAAAISARPPLTAIPGTI